MHVHKLTAYVVRLPLRRSFGHAGHVRQHSDNLLVRCELRGRTRRPVVGWGEGVPRDDAMGETPESALAQLERTPCAEQLAAGATTWNDVIALVDRFQPALTEGDERGYSGNALRCAVELSLLDAYGKLFGEPVSRAIHHLPDAAPLLGPRRWVQYSTIIDATRHQRLRAVAVKMRAYGFRHCKIKVGLDRNADPERLAAIRTWIGSAIDLRLDANGAWRAEEFLERLAALEPYDISCIEQPLPHEDLEALRELRRQTKTPIMLDESLTSLEDAERAIRLEACDLFNIRLSKCGGLLSSVRLAILAHRHGLGYQIGCHPGESGILSAAGRQLATTLGGWWYLEGSYDRHLLRLRNPITRHDMTFRYGGWARRINCPGLGTAVVPRRIRRRTRGVQEVLVAN
jgi:L-alanine-DL-glutamate epimerase-like enolase superfamily enzyme